MAEEYQSSDGADSCGWTGGGRSKKSDGNSLVLAWMMDAMMGLVDGRAASVDSG